MKSLLFRLTALLVAALLPALAKSAPAADKKTTPVADKKTTPVAEKKATSVAEKKGKPPRATPSPTDQLESARVATRKQPMLAAEATFKRDKFELHLKVRRVADDWELVLLGKQPMTIVRKDGSYFLSDDGGKTWRPTLPDDELAASVFEPLESTTVAGATSHRPTYESLGKEDVNGEELLHLRVEPNPSDKTEAAEPPAAWLVSDGRNGWLLRRLHTTTTLFKQTVSADITYTKLPNGTTIEVPSADATAKP
jgi:hypothetical protein